MKRFLLARELPAIFTLAMVGAILAFSNGQPAFGGWLACAALWCALLWIILLPTGLLRQAHHRDQPDHHQHRTNEQHRCQQRRSA